MSNRRGVEAIVPFSIGVLLLLCQRLTLLGASVASWQPSQFLQAPGCQSWPTASGLGIASSLTSCVISRNTTLQRGQPAELPLLTWIQGQGAAGCAPNGGEGGEGPPQSLIPPPEPSSGYQAPLPPASGSGGSSPTVTQIPQQGPGFTDLPSLDLASLSGMFMVPANGSLALCNLRLEGAIVPSTYPLPAASFLSLSAFNLTAALDRRAPSQPPPLQLSNLVIVMPSCLVLSLYQTFACNLSPSPNFTVTPTSLVVHRFITPTAYIQNVTLTCSTTAAAASPATAKLPFPSCLAVKAASGSELLGAIVAMDSMASIARNEAALITLVAYCFLESDISLLETPTTQQVTISTTTIVLAGRPGGSTVLDLHGSFNLISVSKGTSLELRHLVLRNAPLGPPTEADLAFLRIFLWTFSFQRQLYGATYQTTLTVTNVTLELPREELALWFHDILGRDRVPKGLQVDLCVCNVTGAMNLDTALVETVQVPSRGPSLLWRIGSSLTSSYIIRNMLVTVDDGASWCSSDGGDTLLPEADTLTAPLESPMPTAGSSFSAAVGCSVCMRSRASLCLFVPAGVCDLPVSLANAYTMMSSPPGSRMNVPTVSLQPVASWTLEPDLVLKDVVYLRTKRNPAMTFTGSLWDPGMITRPSTLLGSFTMPVALDVALLPGAIVLANTSSSGIFNASLTIRGMILVNLPPAGEWSWFVPSLPTSQPPRSSPGPLLPPAPVVANLEPLPPSRRLMQQHGGLWDSSSSSGSDIIGGTERLQRSAGGGRVLQQEWGNRASTNPPGMLTRGLDPAMTNFTSCLWVVDFDRGAASARQTLLVSRYSNGSLESVIIGPHRPMGLPYVFLDSVVAVIPQSELDLLVRVWATNSTDAVTTPGLADQLMQMLTWSHLSLESARMVSGATSKNITVTRLVFDQLWWCALEGYNVTFTSQLPQQFWGKVSSPSALQLYLPVDSAQRPAASPDPPPPLPSLPPRQPPPASLALPSLPKSPLPPSSPAWRLPSPPHDDPPLSSDLSPSQAEAVIKPAVNSPEAAGGMGQPHTKAASLVMVVCAGAATLGAVAAFSLAFFVVLRWKQRRQGRRQGNMSSEGKPAGGCKAGDMREEDAASLAHRQTINIPREVAICSGRHDGVLLALYNVMHTLILRAAAGVHHPATEVDSSRSDASRAGEAEAAITPSQTVAGGLAHPGAGGGEAAVPRTGSAAKLAPASSLAVAGAGPDGLQEGDPVLTISGELGCGAQGVVYRGVWRGLDVAVKSRLLQCGLVGGGPQGPMPAVDASSLDLDAPHHQAIQEAAISTSVSHPNVVATYTFTLQRLGDTTLLLQPNAAAIIMIGNEKLALQVTNSGSASSTQKLTVGASAGTGELEVWKLTLVQELCDGNSLRHCLGKGALAGCKVVETQSSGPFGTWRRLLVAPVSAASGGGLQSSETSHPAALQCPAAGPGSPTQLDERIMLTVALQAARGLAHLHSLNIVHADVSSANILLKRLPSKTGGDGHGSGAVRGCSTADPYYYGYVAKVSDFGLSGKLDDTREATHLSGPARAVSAYTAPELARHGHASHAGDVYAFAVVLWELALGCPLPALLGRPEGARLQTWLAQQSRMDPQAVEALPPSLLMWPAGGVPPGLVELVGECLRSDPATRPSAQQLYGRLHTLLVGEPPPSHQQTQPSPAPQPSPQPWQQQQQQQLLLQQHDAPQERSAVSTAGPGTSYLSLGSSTVTSL